MLSERIKNGYQFDNDFNCAEAIVYGANEVYTLGIEKEALKVSAAFGGGMGIQSTCGAVTGALMILGMWFNENVQHQSPQVREKTYEYFEAFKKEFGSLQCSDIKEENWHPTMRCSKVIIEAARILDDIYLETQKNI